MLILVGTVLAMLLVPLLGGRLSAAGRARPARRPPVAAALGLQVLAITVVPPGRTPCSSPSTRFVRPGRGLRLDQPARRRAAAAAAGGALNALAIAVNGGQMPASEAAVRRGRAARRRRPLRQLRGPRGPAAALARRRLRLAGWLPLRNVYSLGDLLLLAGAVWVVHRACGSRLPGLRTAPGGRSTA